jgi:hypothetical protein
MINIPTRLQDNRFNFCLILKETKRPFEIDWINKTYKFNDPVLLNHLANDGNYGVVCGKNLMVLDFDNGKIQETLAPKLPDTFIVRSGGKRLQHRYYFVDVEDPKTVSGNDDEGRTLFDLQGSKKCAVGPGSKVVSGYYDISNDIEIATIKYNDLLEVLKPYCKIKEEVKDRVEIKNNDEVVDKVYSKFSDLLKDKVSISSVLNYLGVDTSRNPAKCPLHEMTGNGNLHFNDEMGVAKCFHGGCEEGFNIFTLIEKVKKVDYPTTLEILSDIGGVRKEFEEDKRLYKERMQKEREKEIELPGITAGSSGKLIGTFTDEVVDKMKDTNIIFYRTDSKSVVEIKEVTKKQNDEEYREAEFSQVQPCRFVSLSEKFVTPVIKVYSKKDGKDIVTTKKKNISSEIAKIMLESDNLICNIPKIDRMFTVPIPIIYGNKLTFPKRGYDNRFNSWLPLNAPKINVDMNFDEAKSFIDDLFSDFCFLSEQDRVNAIAGLLTPFLRGLYSRMNVRTPLFFYIANRERAGKDFCAGLTGITYEGFAKQDKAISTGDKFSMSEELNKCILSAFISGRKRLHFANNKGRLENSAIEGLVTNEVFVGRILGKTAEVSFENEMEFSASGNVGITYSGDFANRCRFIQLHLEIENANDRVFKRPNLDEYVKENRDKVLSSLFALVKNWFSKGRPKGSKPFASFHQWSEICGGIMEAAGYGNPCEKSKEELSGVSGDIEFNKMKELFEVCYSKEPNKYLSSGDIWFILSNNEHLQEIFECSLNPQKERSEKTILGLLLKKFSNRILSNIKLNIDTSDKSRVKYIFTEVKLGDFI